MQIQRQAEMETETETETEYLASQVALESYLFT